MEINARREISETTGQDITEQVEDLHTSVKENEERKGISKKIKRKIIGKKITEEMVNYRFNKNLLATIMIMIQCG